MFVFVYGTLKHGYGNHAVLRDAYCLGAATTVGKYRLYDAGFPVMRWPIHQAYSKLNAKVRGEVYHFTSTEILRRLDALESEGRMYHRTPISVKLDDGGAMLRTFSYIGDTEFWRHKTRASLYRIGANGCYEWQPGAERIVA